MRAFRVRAGISFFLKYLFRLYFLLITSYYTFPLFHELKAPKKPVACGKVVKLSRK